MYFTLFGSMVIAAIIGYVSEKKWLYPKRHNPIDHHLPWRGVSVFLHYGYV